MLMFKRPMMPSRGAIPARLMGRPMSPAAPASQLINNRNPLPAGYDASKYTAAGKPFYGMKKGGKVKSSASKRADGVAQRGKTKGRFV